MCGRLWLPTLAELIDRWTILDLKEQKLGKHPDITKEMELISQDINNNYEFSLEDDIAAKNARKEIFEINKEIWELQDKMAELTPSDKEYRNCLVKAHLVNSRKNIFKNQLLNLSGELNESTKRAIFK